MNMPESMTTMVAAYLNHRRQAGFALAIEGTQLLRFARFAEHAGHRGPLTVKLGTMVIPEPAKVTFFKKSRRESFF